MVAHVAVSASDGGEAPNPGGSNKPRNSHARPRDGKLSSTSLKRLSMVANHCWAQKRSNGKSDSCLPSSCQRFSPADTRKNSARTTPPSEDSRVGNKGVRQVTY